MATHGVSGRLSRPASEAERGWRLAALLTLLLLLTSATAGIARVLREPDLAILWPSVVFGLLAGWTLATLRQPLWRSALAGAAAGLVYVMLLPGGLLGYALPIAAELIRLAGGIGTYLKGGSIELTGIVDRSGDLVSAVGTIMGRVQVWVTGLAFGEPIFDPAAAAIVWHITLWSVAAWAGWIIVRLRNTLLAVAPAAILSIATLATAGRTTIAVYSMLGAILLTLAIVQQEQRQGHWERTGVAYPAPKGRQIVGIAAIAAAALVLASGLLASVSLERIQDWIRELREPQSQADESLAGSLGIVSEGASGTDGLAEARDPGLPRDHLIGSGPELSKRVVMTVALPGPRPLLEDGRGAPLYWRSYTYDIYTGQGWSSSPTEETVYEAGELFATTRTGGQIQLEQRVFPVEDLGATLYTAGDPVSVSLAAEAAWRSPGDLFGSRLAGKATYTAISRLPIPDERALLNAGQRYPDWVRARYLALPAEVPGRVRALATRLTASQSAPYDRARAIEEYLRAYPYNLEVDRPSVHQDVVDFFLFDLKTGYCDYYASAMAVLARASGVPARLAVGYAGGTYDLNSRRFIVTEADAHSWVEVYFPRIGWVPFEPTAARPALNRLPVARPEDEQTLLPAVDGTASAAGKPSDWRNLLLVAIATTGALVAAWIISDQLKLRRLSQAGRAAEIYRRLRRLGQGLQTGSAPGDTPHEFAAALRARASEIAARMRAPSWALQMMSDIDKITDSIVITSFCPSPPQDLRLLGQWRSLSWRLRWLRLVSERSAFPDQFESYPGSERPKNIDGSQHGRT